MGLCKEAIRRNTFFSNKNSVSYNREIFKVYYFIFKKYNIPLFLLFLFKVEFYRYLKNIKLLRTLLHNSNSVTELKFKNIYEAAKYLKK
jgi:hypothetical protein